MTRQYAINIQDGRIVLCTRETLENVEYHAISKEVAEMVENGKLPKETVIAKILAKIQTTPNGFKDLITKGRGQNVHHSEITRETIEKLETVVQPEDVCDEFTMSDIQPPAQAPVEVTEVPVVQPESSVEEAPAKRGRPPKAN